MSRSIKVKDIPAGNDSEGKRVIRISVNYDIGGANYFTGTNSARGYYLSVQPIKIHDRDGYKYESMIGFTGVGKCIQESSRFSQKVLEKLAGSCEEEHKESVEKLIKYVQVKDPTLKTEESLDKYLEIA